MTKFQKFRLASLPIMIFTTKNLKMMAKLQKFRLALLAHSIYQHNNEKTTHNYQFSALFARICYFIINYIGNSQNFRALCAQFFSQLLSVHSGFVGTIGSLAPPIPKSWLRHCSHDKMSTSEASRNYRHYDIIFVILGNMRSFSTFCFWNTMASGASRIFFTEYFARHGSKEIFNKDFNGHTILNNNFQYCLKSCAV